ncbi:hypothetical protein F511_27539 [Dorcoceras hygrometricum]|uniref:Uncharacterized protein n=1 Tax=Dorcoceras hygrometricum TaxID=472368 RepID=A0A2Z7APT4_9LAMI|nr:hypothetical protein F511_27539 [Dorcoceras hygrometricum]
MGSNPSTESNYKTAVNSKNKMQMLCMRKETTAQRNLQHKMWPRVFQACYLVGTCAWLQPVFQEPGASRLIAVVTSIRSTTRSETPSSDCTKSPDEISTIGFSTSNWPEQISGDDRRRAAAAALGEEGRGGYVLDSIGYPRMSASGESSTTMHRLLHASGSHPIPTPGDPKTNRYNQDLGLIHSTNGNHLESPKEDSSIDHQFYLNDATHGRRQQLCDLDLANNNLQEWYRKEELLKRSPTLPRTSQTMAGNDGNHRIKSTVNSTRVRETEVDNQDNISLIMGSGA